MEKYFEKKKKIFGIDINPECKKIENENIKIFIGDQTDEKFLKNIIQEIGHPNLILDDGGHTSNQQISSFNYLFEEMQKEGMYLVEDTHTSYNSKFQDREDKLTFVEYAKILSDELNDWYRVKDYSSYKVQLDSVPVSYWAKNIYKITFYNSIVAFEKKSSQIPRSCIK